MGITAPLPVRTAPVSTATSSRTRPPVRLTPPPIGLPRRSRDALLAAARTGLTEAALAPVPGERYALAHLSALRLAAAVLADRAQSVPGHRGRPLSAWRLLVRVAPELEEWANFFAAGAAKRSAAEAGLPVVTRRDADDLIRQSEAFLEVVEVTLGLLHQPVLGPVDADEDQRVR